MTCSVSSWCIEIVTPAICVFTIARAARILFFNKKNVNNKFRSARGGFEFLPFFASAMGRCFCMARCFSKGSASAWQRHVLRSACLLVLPSSCDPVWDFKRLRFCIRGDFAPQDMKIGRSKAQYFVMAPLRLVNFLLSPIGLCSSFASVG